MSNSQLTGTIKEYRELVIHLMEEMIEERDKSIEYGKIWAISNPYKKVYKCMKDRLVKIDNILEDFYIYKIK